MALSAGTRLGPYEILAPIGTGGMGEVYRARDPRMGREVAIKVSAERFTDRFEREVHAVAALNHPNICHLYDVGPNYLVMELVEGPTLAERIKEGALPLEEVLPIARQIADALEAAHEKGIIHRDLKPANIKIKPDGTIKVLDFGLAKMADQTTSTDPEISPTRAMEATRAGEILGTAAYMAPEQARGKTLDKRVDIWAFGVVLYEMLSGQRLFDGESVTDTLAAVLTKEPEWNRVPVKAQQLLRSCLEKDPKRRLRDIGDAWRLLEDAPVPAAKNGWPWKVAAGVLAMALAIALWAPWRGVRPPAEQSVMRLDLDLGPDVSLASTTGPAVILSPDGTALVFVSQGLRRYASPLYPPAGPAQVFPVVGHRGAYAPFFSPDGQWVGFFAQGKLKKTRIDGSEPISLCDAPAGRGATWGDDGAIIAALDTLAGLSQVPAAGGKAVAVTSLNPEEKTHRWPQVLPGGKAVLFNASRTYGSHDDGIAVVSLKDRRTKMLIEHAGMFPRYLLSGHLVYVTKGTLVAVPFDPERLEVQGTAALLEEVSSNANLGSAQADFSRSGTLAYRSGGREGVSTIQWLDGAGTTEAIEAEPATYNSPRLSPDGLRLAYATNQGSTSDIWICDLQRGGKIRLTNGTESGWPVWSPDGRFVVFQAAGGIFWKRADGAGSPRPLTQGKNLYLPSSFTSDGTRLVFSEVTPEGGAEIRTVPVDGRSGQMRAGEQQFFLKTSTVQTFAAFSPDGRWLAYADAEAGSYDVYVRAFPDKGTQVLISNAGGVMPVWSRNGRELFYRALDNRIMVANYTVKGESFAADKPRVWFGKPLANIGFAGNFDLAPDGKRFAVLMPVESSEPRENQSHVRLVVNFFDEVRRRVAAQGK